MTTQHTLFIEERDGYTRALSEIANRIVAQARRDVEESPLLVTDEMKELVAEFEKAEENYQDTRKVQSRNSRKELKAEMKEARDQMVIATIRFVETERLPVDAPRSFDSMCRATARYNAANYAYQDARKCRR